MRCWVKRAQPLSEFAAAANRRFAGNEKNDTRARDPYGFDVTFGGCAVPKRDEVTNCLFISADVDALGGGAILIVTRLAIEEHEYQEHDGADQRNQMMSSHHPLGRCRAVF